MYRFVSDCRPHRWPAAAGPRIAEMSRKSTERHQRIHQLHPKQIQTLHNNPGLMFQDSIENQLRFLTNYIERWKPSSQQNIPCGRLIERIRALWRFRSERAADVSGRKQYTFGFRILRCFRFDDSRLEGKIRLLNGASSHLPARLAWGLCEGDRFRQVSLAINKIHSN